MGVLRQHVRNYNWTPVVGWGEEKCCVKGERNDDRKFKFSMKECVCVRVCGR